MTSTRSTPVEPATCRWGLHRDASPSNVRLRTNSPESTTHLPALHCRSQITLVEATEVLGSFDVRLREYTVRKLTKSGIHLLKGVVREVRRDEIELQVRCWRMEVGGLRLGMRQRRSNRPLALACWKPEA